MIKRTLSVFLILLIMVLRIPCPSQPNPEILTQDKNIDLQNPQQSYSFTDTINLGFTNKFTQSPTTVGKEYYYIPIPVIENTELSNVRTKVEVKNFTEHLRAYHYQDEFLQFPSIYQKQVPFNLTQDPTAWFTDAPSWSWHFKIEVLMSPESIDYSNAITYLQIDLVNIQNNGIKNFVNLRLPFVQRLYNFYYVFEKTFTAGEITNYDPNYRAEMDTETMGSYIYVTIMFNSANKPQFYDGFYLTVDTQYRLNPTEIGLKMDGVYFGASDLYNGIAYMDWFTGYGRQYHEYKLWCNLFDDPDLMGYVWSWIADNYKRYRCYMQITNELEIDLQLAVQSSTYLVNNTMLNKFWDVYNPELKLSEVNFAGTVEYIYLNGVKYTTNQFYPNTIYFSRETAFSISVVLELTDPYAVPLQSIAFSQIPKMRPQIAPM